MTLDDFTDLGDAMAYLRQHHYRYTFQGTRQGWRCAETHQVYSPEDLALDGCHRFQQQIGAAMATTFLYAVTAPQGRKGIILDNCRTYANPRLGDLLVLMKLQYLDLERKSGKARPPGK